VKAENERAGQLSQRPMRLSILHEPRIGWNHPMLTASSLGYSGIVFAEASSANQRALSLGVRAMVR
jgi:hypothetical protein